MFRFLCFILIGFLISSCEKDGEFETLWVYKTKADYSDKVTVKLASDKKRVTAFPGPWDIDYRWPIKLNNGYYLNGVFGGINTGITKLTKEEYSDYPVALGSDSLYKLLIDKDPFTEFYEFEDKDNVFDSDTGIDTIKLNQLINENNLEKYFIRLK